jgi:hypothetical protein
VPCGQGQHAFRWEAGSLQLPEHPDAEGEFVLAALGGEKARCIELAQTWERHTADLSVLGVFSRSASEQIQISWDDVATAAQARPPGSPVAYAPHPGGRASSVPMRLASQSPSLSARAAARHRQMQEETDRDRLRWNDMRSLLALGPGFQLRLAGQVVAAYADRLDETVRPAVGTALSGRLALVAADWIGIDPGQVAVSLHTGPGWGTAELTGRGEERRLRVSLPAWWLARVWACCLALTGRHLVVAVEQAGWPDARVLGLPAPGAEPVLLDVHAREPSREPGAAGAGDGLVDAGDTPHWEV